MKLKKLLKDLLDVQVRGPRDIEISGICSHSKRVSPGNLFIAKKSALDQGSLYIKEAIDAGAVAIATDVYDPTLKNITQVICTGIAALETLLPARYYEFPANDLFVVGITGTNGKTTSSFFIKHLLETSGKKCGLLGTIQHLVGNHSYQATLTTPDSCTVQRLLREMELHGCSSAVMEVSSHALTQQRTANIDFDVAVFTNISPEHLDYHITMENYVNAKSKLFSGLRASGRKKCHSIDSTAVVNCDSPWHSEMIKNCSAEQLLYGLGPKAELRAQNLRLTASETIFTLSYRGKTAPCSTQHIGRHNVYNYLAAAAVGIVCQLSLEEIVAALSSAPPVEGRLQKIPNNLGIHIYVDFAHTADALENVLQSLSELPHRRIITVFGCGGDRDRSKRPKMAAVAEKYSEFTIVTNDNPRSEDPAAIAHEICTGFDCPERAVVELDRAKAIAIALESANEGDVVLIAGKGHEDQQLYANQTISFRDSNVALALCKELSTLQTKGSHEHSI